MTSCTTPLGTPVEFLSIFDERWAQAGEAKGEGSVAQFRQLFQEKGEEIVGRSVEIFFGGFGTFWAL